MRDWENGNFFRLIVDNANKFFSGRLSISNFFFHFLHSAFSTLRIFYIPHFPHFIFSTLRTFYTSHFLHSALRVFFRTNEDSENSRRNRIVTFTKRQTR